MTTPRITRPSRQGGKFTPRRDYLGKRIGRFTVVGIGDRQACFTWRCRCVCGEVRDIASRHMAQYAREGWGCGACHLGRDARGRFVALPQVGQGRRS